VATDGRGDPIVDVGHGEVALLGQDQLLGDVALVDLMHVGDSLSAVESVLEVADELAPGRVRLLHAGPIGADQPRPSLRRRRDDRRDGRQRHVERRSRLIRRAASSWDSR
jgi:hypothetical protein